MKPLNEVAGSVYAILRLRGHCHHVAKRMMRRRVKRLAQLYFNMGQSSTAAWANACDWNGSRYPAQLGSNELRGEV